MRLNQEGEESTKATIYIRNLGFPLLLIVITLLTVTAFIVLKKRKLNKIVQRLVKYKASIEPHQAYNISIVSHQYYRRPSVAFSEQNTRKNKPLQGMAPTECIPSACLPAYLPACLLACLLACLIACLRACLSACLRACLCACLPACLLVCLSACLPACVPTCLLACLACSHLDPFLSSLELIFNDLLRKVTD